MARLRGCSRFFHGTDLAVNGLEIHLNGIESLLTASEFLRLREIDFTQLTDLGFGGGVLVIRAREVERGLYHEARRFGTFENNEILVLPLRIERDEVQFFPERVDFAPGKDVQDQLIQRAI